MPELTALETAAATTPFISELPSRFMLDGATYARGGELGYDGLDFYAAGRGGTLGDVDADVVAAAFVFFNPTMVRDYWERAAKVGPVEAAGREFAACAHQWGRDHLGPVDAAQLTRLADLLARVVASANPAGAPLFAAWRALDEPADAPARVIHYANALRELRGARHGCAVLAAGVEPRVAVHVKSPHMAAMFGWPEPVEDLEAHRSAWNGADAETDTAFAPAFEALDANERYELVDLAASVYANAT